MTSLKYEKIYSRLFKKIEAYDFIDMTEFQIKDFLCDWLHSSMTRPHVRRLFSFLSFDDTMESLKYEMKYSVDVETDTEFVIEIIVLGMMVEWLQPKIFSSTNILQTFGSKEEKFYSEAAHLKQLQELEKSCVNKQKSIISDKGAFWNKYLDGGLS